MEHFTMPELISNSPSDNRTENAMPVIARKDPIQKAQQIRQSPGFVELPPEELEGGGILLRAKVTDAFCFVDHPMVELDPSGAKITAYSCDCPESRVEGRFCAHCTALVIGQQKMKKASSAAQKEDAPKQEKPEVQVQEAPENQNAEGPELMDLSYKFCNAAYDLYPFEKNPNIPLERYIQVYGDNARARDLYESTTEPGGGWGGSCFGFVSTTSLLYQPDGGVTVAEFDPNAKIPSEVALTAFNKSLDMTLHSFVEAMQITQYGNGMWYDITLDELAAATEAFQNGTGEPIAMGIQSSRYSCDGHAILPFRLERTNGPEDILHIYDPNYPLKTRFGYLEKNAEGKYIHWRFPANDRKTYGSRTGGILDHSPYARFKSVWDNRGGRKAKNLLIMKPGAALLDAAGAMMARVTESGVETFSDDVSHNIVMSGRSKGTPILSLPVGTFRVVMEDPDLEELSVRLIGMDLSIDCSTFAQEIELCVDDETKMAYVQIPTADVRYTIRILNTLDETEEETVLNGVTEQDALCLKQEYGQLYASGLTEQAALYINRVNTSLDTIKKLEAELEEEQEELLIANSNAVVVDEEDPQ